ncbi:MAG: peptidylprolyl isomerase [Ruminococcus sp.]|nr:peptidylprolyl isomerase [Ruminococcus sp.]
MIKKISAFLIAMTITIGCFASCSTKGDDSSSNDSVSEASSASNTDSTAESTIPEASLTIDGKKVDTKDLIICTVDGHDIDFDTFRYYYFYTLMNYTNTYGVTLETLTEIDDGFNIFMKDVVNSIKQEYVAQQLADENGIKLTEDDKKTIDSNIKSTQTNYESEEDYLNALKSSYLTEDLLKKMYELSTIYQKVDSELFSNGGKYATSEKDFKKIVQDTDEYSRVIHVLIPYECQVEITDSAAKETYDSDNLSTKLSAKQSAYKALSEDEQAKAKEKAKKLAEEVLQKAKDGEDFKKLVEKYGWDPGMESSPEGYYINENTSFVQEFKDTAFKLKENEISGLVENDSYGWFIIKRLPVDMDYVDEHLEDMIKAYDSPKISELYNERTEKMEVVYGEIFDKITADSIT